MRIKDQKLRMWWPHTLCHYTAPAEHSWAVSLQTLANKHPLGNTDDTASDFCMVDWQRRVNCGHAHTEMFSSEHSHETEDHYQYVSF